MSLLVVRSTCPVPPQPLYGTGQLRYNVMVFGKILWLWKLAFSWKASCIMNLNIVQKHDRQDTGLIFVELRVWGV